MYFGRHVVRRPYNRLRPVAGSVVRASTSTPWQIAPTGRPSAQTSATLPPKDLAAQVLPHAGRVPAGQDQTVETRRDSTSSHASGARNSRSDCSSA